MQEQEGELAALLDDIRRTFAVEFEPLQVDGVELQILGIRNMRSHLDALLLKKAVQDPLRDLPLWAKVWPGSFVLGRLLRRFEPEGRTLLELGAGCGILSIIAAGQPFARIVASDVNDMALKFARANVLRNGLADRVETRFVDVAATPAGGLPRFDLIAASEILYLDSLHRPLLRFLARFLAPGGKAVFCTDVARAKPRFARLAGRSFKVSERHVGVRSQDEEGAEDRRLYSILTVERDGG